MQACRTVRNYQFSRPPAQGRITAGQWEQSPHGIQHQPYQWELCRPKTEKFSHFFYSGCSTVLTSSMLNCRKVEEHVISIMRAESGVQMESTHKCRKTHYDPIEGGSVTNGLDSQVMLEKNSAEFILATSAFILATTASCMVTR